MGRAETRRQALSRRQPAAEPAVRARQLIQADTTISEACIPTYYSEAQLAEAQTHRLALGLGLVFLGLVLSGMPLGLALILSLLVLVLRLAMSGR